MTLLKHIVNSYQRQFFIDKVNAPLWLDIVTLGKRYPEPTHENVVHPNSHILIDIRDQFYEVWDLPKGLTWVTESLWRIVIVKYEHSPNWRHFLDWAIMMVGKSEWKPFDFNRQMPLWRKQ